jgi:hypothetical protein
MTGQEEKLYIDKAQLQETHFPVKKAGIIWAMVEA